MIVIFWFMMAGACIPELGGLWKLGYHWQPSVMHFVSETSRCKAQDQDLTVSRKQHIVAQGSMHKGTNNHLTN
jgi:hypothetical protein